MRRFLVIIGILLITGCGKPRPMTFEEQQAYMAKQACAEQATSLNPEWPNSNNPAWNAYFVMCMNQFGIPDSVLRHMWY